MSRVNTLSLLMLAAGLFACSPVKAPASDAGPSLDDDAGEQFECDPTCGDDATCSADLVCECDEGFEGDGFDCADIDECAADNGGCDVNATCNDFDGGHSCECNPGFQGDGETCVQVWARIGVLDGAIIDNEGFGIVSTLAANSILFGPRTNIPGASFMMAFRLGAGEFSPPLSMPGGDGDQNDFCACGLTSVFVGTENFAYLLGNQGMRYGVSADNWRGVLQYNGNARGEAAAAFVNNENAVLLIGGRDQQTTATRMDFNALQESFEDEPGELPVPMDSAFAFSPPGSNTVFVAGGFENEGRALLQHQLGSDVWEELADAPEDLGKPLGMGSFDGLIWVAKDDGEFRFYDPKDDSWLSQNLFAPPGLLSALHGPQGTFVILQNANGVEIHQLMNLPF